MKTVKALIVVAILLIAATAVLYASASKERKEQRDDAGHVLITLWKKYESAVNADKPQMVETSLSEIKSEASERHLPWDFYDAGRRYVDASSIRNWKVRDSLDKAFTAEIEAFGEPVMSYVRKMARNSRSGILDFVNGSAKDLAKGHNDQFYTSHGVGSLCYGDLVSDSIEDDLEFVLWDIVTRRMGDDSDAAYAMLSEKLGDRYPEAALLELSRLDKDGCEAFAKKYEGKGVSFIALQQILEDRFIDMDGKSGQDGYVALRDECKALISRMKSLDGAEKRVASCCSLAEDLIRTMDSKYVSSFVADGELSVVFRNLESALVTVSAKDGKEVFRRQVADPARSYYVLDTVKLKLPAIDDGDYVLKTVSGKVDHECEYHRSTVSVASRSDADTFRIYAADYMTGRPVAKADLILMSSGREIARCDDFVFDGFTPVPASFVKKVSGGKYSEIICEYRDEKGVLHRSGSTQCRDKENGRSAVDADGAVILCDRTAFKPGEKLLFKGILFHGDRYVSLEPVGTGVYVDAVLVDTEGKEVASRTLVTNEFGSVAGSFDIPLECRHGSFMLDLRKGRMTLQSEYLTVDEFVLPSYTIEFEPNVNLYLPGDAVHFKGRVKSYSGHSLAGASVTATVTSWRDTLSSKVVELTPDGSFDVEFNSDPEQTYADYRCELKVVDGTGETLSEAFSVMVRGSLDISCRLENESEGSSEFDGTAGFSRVSILDGDVAKVSFGLGPRDGLEIGYELLKDGKSLGKGIAVAGTVKEIRLPSAPGLYEIRSVVSAVTVSGRKLAGRDELYILKLNDSDTVLDAPLENVFRKIEGDGVSFQLGAASGEVWAVFELFDSDRHRILSDKIHLDGRRGEQGSLKTLNYAYDPKWSDVVNLSILYFRNGRAYRFNASYERKLPKMSMPLEFGRVVDVSGPGEDCSITLKTGADAECAVSVFDLSTEMIHPNEWLPVRLWQYGDGMWYSVQNGYDRSDMPVRVRGAALYKSAARASAMGLENVVVSDMAVGNVVEEDAIPFQLVEKAASFGAVADVQVREDFASTLAFEPFLRSDKDGNVSFSFRTGDKLSTFIIQAFVHDRQFNNQTARREMKVTLPVRMSVVEPLLLYSGDRYVLKATVSSNTDAAVSGSVSMDVFDGASWKDSEPLMSAGGDITVPAGGVVPLEYMIDVPEADTLGIKLTFRSSDSPVSDAVFVKVPVLKPAQTLVEAHSAVLAAGADCDKLIAALRGRFVNVPGAEASVTDISIHDMVKEAVPGLVRTDRNDLVSVLNALYSGILAKSLGENVAVPVKELERKLLLCRCDCGGFSWFEDMDASPILTSLVLERYYALSRRGLDVEVRTLGAMVPDAVKYLDRSYFADGSQPWWRGSLSLQQYLHVRSLYVGTAFDSSSARPAALKEFRKAAKEYLIPRGERGLNGRILMKSRRCLTLMHLSQGGAPLLASWGISLGKMRRIRESCISDVESLLEYAVEHKDGGYYYPNAVMPWRGLMESELYAHVVLCDMLDSVAGIGADAALSLRASEVAEGVRLWIMLQKETQQWGDDPAYVDALASVLDGAPETLATRVIALKAEFTKPFRDVVASGNGFSVSRTYLRDGAALKDGDVLKVGDRIIAEYSIRNDENRSFVLLSCPRPASLRPVRQLSGRLGWWRGAQGYRNVLNDRSEYWYDSYPEEITTVTEDFYVTQKGVFQTPAVSIESLYAPHYRANDAGCSPIESR